MRDFKLRRRFNKLVKDGGAGGGGNIMRVGLNRATMALDKTWQEISDCFANGGYAYLATTSQYGTAGFHPILNIGSVDEEYSVTIFVEWTQATNFVCSSPDEYPTYDNSANT